MTIVKFAVLLAVAAVVAEYLTRWMIRRRRYLVWPANHKQTMHLDPDAHPTLQKTVRFHTNDDGERGSTVKGRSRVFRCVAAGGSTVESYLIDQPSSWPQVLQDHLQHPNVLQALGVSGAHVGNIGKSGVDSRALRLILERVLPQYDPPPDLVLTMVGASDILRWLELGAHKGETAEAMSTSECFYRHPEFEFSWNLPHTALCEYPLECARDVRRKRHHTGSAVRWYKKAREMRANATTVIRQVPDASAVCAAYEANLRSMITTVRSHAKHLIIVRQPWLAKKHYSADEEAIFWHGGIGKVYRGDRISTYFSAEVISELMQRLDEIAADVASRALVPHVDLKQALEMSTEYFIDQFHMRASASEPIARCLVPIIIDACRAERTNLIPCDRPR